MLAGNKCYRVNAMEWQGWRSKISLLNSSIRKGLPKKVTFDSEGSEGAYCAWGRSVPDRENS